MANRLDRAGYEALTVPDLRKEAGNRQLDTSGNKPDLVDRLVADDRSVEQVKPELDDESEFVTVVPEPDGEPDAFGADDPDDDDLDPEPERVRDQKAIEAGGHTLLVDVDPETPPEIATCSICGGDNCTHLRPDYGQTWATTEAAEAAPVVQDGTFWPDETVGPRSAETEEKD